MKVFLVDFLSQKKIRTVADALETVGTVQCSLPCGGGINFTLTAARHCSALTSRAAGGIPRSAERGSGRAPTPF